MRDNFGAVMAHIFRHEGGYVDHPKDPGGATNMGITHATLAASIPLQTDPYLMLPPAFR